MAADSRGLNADIVMALIHENVTNSIIGTAFEVDRILGYEFLEKVYHKTMQVESTRLRYQIKTCVTRVNPRLNTH